MNLGMVAATWKSVEAVGIPDSPVRRMLFDLADRFQNHGPNDDIALLPGAFTALMDVLQEHHADKTPLQVQAEARRTTRDLRARGINIPISSSATRSSSSRRRHRTSLSCSWATRTADALSAACYLAGSRSTRSTLGGSR